MSSECYIRRELDLERLGIPARDGTAVEQDHRKIWQIFADNYFLFHGTPTGMWLNHELHDVFGVREQLTSRSAMRIYDLITDKLTSPAFRPRALYERFNIEVLTTTDTATSRLRTPQSHPSIGVEWTYSANFPA